MALIKINGVEIPTPSDYQPGIMDISKAERNANGTMIIERITTKRKLELGWKKLSKEQLSTILNLISPVFFTVEYVDPQDNGFRTGTFYSGDRNCPALSYIKGNIEYNNIKINLIER